MNTFFFKKNQKIQNEYKKNPIDIYYRSLMKNP